MKKHAGDGPAAPLALMINSERAGCNSASGGKKVQRMMPTERTSSSTSPGCSMWTTLSFQRSSTKDVLGEEQSCQRRLHLPPENHLCVFYKVTMKWRNYFFPTEQQCIPAQRKTRKTGSASSQSGTVQPRIKILSFSSSL